MPALTVDHSPFGCSSISTKYVTGVLGVIGSEGFHEIVSLLSVIRLIVGGSGNGNGAPVARYRSKSLYNSPTGRFERESNPSVK